MLLTLSFVLSAQHCRYSFTSWSSHHDL